MLWVKALHIIFMVTWFAGLFYLPRLFVYHSSCEDDISAKRFKLMERRLFYGIMTPASLLTIISGLFLWAGYGITGLWLYAKLVLVSSIIIYQLWCGFIIQEFKNSRNRKSPRFYRWFNEYPTVVLVTVVLLSVVKPV